MKNRGWKYLIVDCWLLIVDCFGTLFVYDQWEAVKLRSWVGGEPSFGKWDRLNEIFNRESGEQPEWLTKAIIHLRSFGYFYVSKATLKVKRWRRVLKKIIKYHINETPFCLDDNFDFSISDVVGCTLCEGTLLHKRWKEDRRVDKLGRATFSAFGSKPGNIKFKANSNSAPIKLTAEDISAFVIGTDSFAIVQNIKINSINGEYARDFAQVVETGHLNLFVHKSSSSDGKFSYEHDKFVISKDNKVFLGIWNFNKQRNEIAEYFSERPDLKNQILDKKDETTLQTLVKEFNKGADDN